MIWRTQSFQEGLSHSYKGSKIRVWGTTNNGTNFVVHFYQHYIFFQVISITLRVGLLLKTQWWWFHMTTLSNSVKHSSTHQWDIWLAMPQAIQAFSTKNSSDTENETLKLCNCDISRKLKFLLNVSNFHNPIIFIKLCIPPPDYFYFQQYEINY